VSDFDEVLAGTRAWHIAEGDCRDWLPRLPRRSVQCVVTSPPYWGGLRDYGMPGQIGHEPTPDRYVQTLVKVFGLIREALRDDGTAWLNLGSCYMKERFEPWGLKPGDDAGIPHRIFFALQAAGWHGRADIVWSKANVRPENPGGTRWQRHRVGPKDQRHDCPGCARCRPNDGLELRLRGRPTKAHEYLFLLTKTARYFYDAEAAKEPAVSDHAVGSKGRTGNRQGGRSNFGHNPPGNWVGGQRNRRSVWDVAVKPIRGHLATFPPELVEPCILAGTSAQGCCPGCGTPWARVTTRKPTSEGGEQVETVGWSP
jgi:hypothetical protein